MLLTDKQRLFASPSLSELPNIAARNVVGIVDVTATTEQWFQTAVNQLIKHAGNIRADELTPQLLRRFQTAVSFAPPTKLLITTSAPSKPSTIAYSITASSPTTPPNTSPACQNRQTTPAPSWKKPMRQ